MYINYRRQTERTRTRKKKQRKLRAACVDGQLHIFGCYRLCRRIKNNTINKKKPTLPRLADYAENPISHESDYMKRITKTRLFKYILVNFI